MNEQTSNRNKTTRALVIGSPLFILFILILCSKPVNAFLSPGTLSLVASSIGSFVWELIILLAVFIVSRLKVIRRNFRFALLFIVICSLSFLAGIISYNYINLKRINTYQPIQQREVNMLPYSMCVKDNYLAFIPTASIRTLSSDEMIPFLLNNKSLNIINMGVSEEKVKFKNAIYIPQSFGEIERIKLVVKNLNKSEPLFIHCHTGHSASMAALFIAKEGFSRIYILQFMPEELKQKMLALGMNTSKYFEPNVEISTKPIIRISFSSNINLLSDKDLFFFYKVNNCKEYIKRYNIFNENNTLCFNNLLDVNTNTKEKINFLCDEESECSYLQAELPFLGIKNIGYLVVLNE